MYSSRGRYQRARHLEIIERELLETLQPDGWDVLVCQTAPRHGKSQYLSRAFPAWYHSVYPYRRTILTSYGLDLARGHSRYVRDEAHRLAPLFGSGGVKQTVSAAADWQMANGIGGMKAAGVGGAMTGYGCDIAIVDDYLKNAEQAISSKVRDAQWEWFQTTLFTRIEPGGRLVILATRWHEEDLIGRLLKFALEDKKLRVREIRLPALAEPTPEQPDPLGRATDEPLWPERWDYEALDRIRSTLDPYWWNALYQQRLGSYGKNQWPTEYFYNIMAQDDEWPESFRLSATALDPSLGKNSKKGDYSAIVTVGFSRGYLWVDASIERRPAPKMMLDLVAWNEQRRPTVTGIEAIAFQELLGSDYKQAQLEMGTYRDEPEMLVDTAPKPLRIARIGQWLRLHRVKIRRTPGGQLLLKQLQEFPNGEFDDGPDALEAAIRLLLKLSDALEGMKAGSEPPVERLTT